jgi:replicative DNA helicase
MNELETIYDLAAERAYISCLIKEKGLVKESSLQADQFFDSKHKNIVHALKAMDKQGKPIDLIMFMEHVGAKVEKVGGAAYVSDLFQSYAAATNFKNYENIILEKWKLRTAVNVLNQAKYDITTDLSVKSIADAAKALNEIDQSGYEDEFDLIETLYEVNEQLETPRNGLKGIDTGYAEINTFTDGLQQSDLIIVAARPSVGKTAFALNVALNAASKPTDDVAIFSLEMSKQQLLMRGVSIRGGIDGVKLRDPAKMFNSDDWTKKTMAIGEISNMNLHIYDKPGATMQYIWSKARKLRNNNPDGKILILIDYLQLITGDPALSGNRNLQVSEISRGLKLMARELNVSVVALSQLSRGVEQRQDKRPMMSDIRDSGSIEQDADVIAFLYRDDYYDKGSENKNIIEIIFAKQRNGPVGTVQLAFVKEYGRFVSLKRTFNE